MFKSSTWRSEKKIKAVFKMQFQATQVPHLKAKTLTISLVPADVGKPTVRLGKSSIREGTCSWESPIYETVKLVKETKTGKFKGKIYHFIVSAGSSKAGFLGEVSVDFVDFLGASDPVMLSLPLEATNSGAILHVIVQRLEQTLDVRYMEEDEIPTPEYYARGLEMQLLDSDNLQNRNLEFTEVEQPKTMTSHHLELSDCLRDTKFQDTSASEVNSTNTDKTSEKVSLDADSPGHIYRSHSVGLHKDTSDDRHQEKYAREITQEASNEVGRLNSLIKMLERQGEVSELELQSLRRQIAKESRKVQELSEQIVALKEERDALKTECEQLESSPKSIDHAEISINSEKEMKALRELSEQIKQELHCEKHLSKKLRFQLQKTEDSNSELILAVRDLKELLSRKNKEIAHLSCKIKANQNEETKELEETVGKQSIEDEEKLLKQEMERLFVERELSRKENEELKMCIQQLTMDYEVLNKEKTDVYSNLEQTQITMMEMQLEYSHSLNTVKILKQEIKDQELQYSESLTIINELKSKIKSLEKELEKEAKDFQASLTAAKKAMSEQEQRATHAEEALRKANLSNSKEAEHLREEFRRKSEEIISQINEKEKLATRAVAEANDLRVHNEALEKLLQKAHDDIQVSKNEYRRKFQDLSEGIHLEAQSMEMVSPQTDVKGNKVKFLKRDDQKEAKAINVKIKNREVGRLKQEKLVCSQAKYEKGTIINDKEQWRKECADSKTQQKRTDERKELERELLLVKKEAEKLIEENITLRMLIDQNNNRDEILHSDMEKLRIQYDELKHCSQEMNLENQNLKKQVFQLLGDPHKKQEIRAVKDVAMCDKTLEEGKGKPENMHSGELGILEGNTSETESYMAKSKRNEIHSRRELNLANHNGSHISDIAKLSNEVASLNELNKHMEVELKEMQERYSEISLKFAEVEGERQQLVMTLRNLKNGKKT